MFDYQVSKHPHFDEACRAFALRHNLVRLAERAGMNVQILRNKLNPAQPHLLTAPEIWLLTDLTEDSTLVDGFLAQIHCLPCVPINEVAKEKLPHYVMSATAEIGRVAAGAVPAIYSNQFAPPSTSADACVTEHPDGGWFEYEPATGRWYVRGIKSMVIEAADNITMKTSEFVLEADRTRINSEVVMNGGVTQGGGAMSSNGIVVDAHQHTGVLKGGDTTGGPV
ncbi:phage baseplate assembly protein V [Escherichia coli]|uniref:phage baseplate assembly protein V n=1 Tax=Escherichia coli TaxID=562 RepID=UPI00300ED88D